MIKSMTGYGKAEETAPEGKFIIEIRSVNHRYGEVNVKLPRQYLALEGDIRKSVAERCKRGKVDVFIQFEAAVGLTQPPQVNLPLAKAYHDAFTALGHQIGNYEPVPLSLIVAQKDVLGAQEITGDLEKSSTLLLSTLSAALDSHERMRCVEGEALAAEINGRTANIEALVDSIAARAPQAVAVNAERLQERITRLLGESQLDEGRIAQEIALLADRMDVTEELVRLRSHFQQLHGALKLAEPVGRKLDFLLQEMNREVNTIGSKANDGEIAAQVIEIKAEMEKIREQVQNIE